jgi:hypothetical protein
MNILDKIKLPLLYAAVGVVCTLAILFFLNRKNPSPPEPDVSYIPYVVGADKVIHLGEIVKLTVVPYRDKPVDLTSWSCTWRIFDGNNEKVLEGSNTETVMFGSGIAKKTLKVYCAVSQVFKDGSSKVFLLIKDLNIGDAPGPGPGPGPTPTPDPTFPDGRFQLSKFIYDASKTVNSPEREREARALSNAINGVASAISAGTIKTPDDALIKCKEANRTALQAISPDSITRWEPTFTALQDRLYQLYTERKINTVSDFADAFREIAVGLNGVR